jgi:hypothetical protein
VDKTVSDWDREYFRRIGEFKAEANADALRRHLARPSLDRLESSVSRSIEYSTPERVQRRLAEDDPTPLYDRARQRGLIED